MKPSEYDLVVVGATPGGIACAVRAAREGLSVLLTNWNAHPGAFFVNGGNILDTLYEGDRSPLLTEFLNLNREFNHDRYGEDSVQYASCFFGDRLDSSARPKISNEAASWIFSKWMDALEELTFLPHYLPEFVEKEGRLIKRVAFRSIQEEDGISVEAPIFVDATYEGDLAALAGVEYHVGRESREDFCEPHAGKIFTWRGEEAPYPREAALGLINHRTFRLTNKQIVAGSTGEGDGAIQAYNFRMALSSDPEKRVPIEQPENYDRARYLGISLPEGEMLKGIYPIKSDALYCGADKISMGGQNHCFPGGNHRYPEAGHEERAAILKAHVDHMLGYYYFIQNDESIPIDTRERNRQFGLDKSLYPDNGHIPYEIYVREARRIRGRYVFKEQDGTIGRGIRRAPVHGDSIAITEWMMDSHDCTTEIRPGSLHDGVLLLTEETRPGQIPYRALLPKDLDNLLVSVCLSATHVGWGTIRLEPVWMHVGEVAAYAALTAIEEHSTPGELTGEQLQPTLVENGIMVAFFNEFDMATETAWAPAVQYFGTKGFFDSYDASPDAPLTVPVAREWAHAFACLGNGDYDAHAVAVAVHSATKAAGPAISGSEFLDLLEKQAAHQAPGESLLRKEAEAMGLNTVDSLARKDACRLIYAFIRESEIASLSFSGDHLIHETRV
jgi:hypothetical protein